MTDHVYIITSYNHADYRIEAVYLSLDEARAAITKQWAERIEVWPVGGGDLLGTWAFSRFSTPQWKYKAYDD